MLSKHQRSKCVLHLFRLGYNKRFIWNSLDKHIHCTLCLEVAQIFQFGDKSQKMYGFAKDNLTHLTIAENDAENGFGDEDG